MLRIIVLNYKRPDNVKAICQAFHKYFPITVINNNPQTAFTFKSKNVITINNNKNKMCIERWIRCYEYDEPYKLILDDDLLPSPLLLKKMLSLDQTIVGIYGKSNVRKASRYEMLTDNWCINAKVDFLVGSAVMVKQEALNYIKNDLMNYANLQRGDDIVVSYLIKKVYNFKFLKTISGQVLNLPEGDVGLNKHPSHFKKRWEVLKQCLN